MSSFNGYPLVLKSSTINFPSFTKSVSTAPWSIMPVSLSVCCMPWKLLRHVFSVSLSSKSLHPFTQSSLRSSGGSSPFSMKLSKCFFMTPSMPDGSDGNGPDGLLMFLMSCIQKHLGHSKNKLRLDGDTFVVTLFIKIIFFIKVIFIYSY